MNKFHRGEYKVRNTHKYAGAGTPYYRSSWEMSFMMFCDNNDNILQWASEPVKIPYRHPLTGKMTIYVPDFIVTYRGPKDSVRAELIEIKPKKQSVLESKTSTNDRATIAVNYAKWAAAQKWSKQYGLFFRVLTEDMIFHQGGKKK